MNNPFNPPSGLSDLSDSSDGSNKTHPPFSLIPRHGGYRKLHSFQAAQLSFDSTVIFWARFISKHSRTHDQMIQAARSGVQNIAEASMASGTSKKTEIKLTNVARASWEELRLDFEDFLRQHGYHIWDKDSPEALAVRSAFQSIEPEQRDPYGISTTDSETAANILLCLINQASYLLGRQIKRLEQDFLEKGGFTENLYAARHEARARQEAQAKQHFGCSLPNQSNRSDMSDQSEASDSSNKNPTPTSPCCPRCQKPMRLRTAKQGPNAGQQFWGCSGYPNCRGTRPVEQPATPHNPNVLSPSFRPAVSASSSCPTRPTGPADPINLPCPQIQTPNPNR